MPSPTLQTPISAGSLSANDSFDLEEWPLKRKRGTGGDTNLSGDRTVKRARFLDCIKVTPSVYPKSRYAGWEPPLAISPEEDAIADLEQEWRASDAGAEETILRLDQFSIYRPSGEGRQAYPFELTSLHFLKTPQGVDSLVFDGILKCGDQHRYVQGVSFECVTVEGYGDLDSSPIDGKVCIQSLMGKERSTWYCLGQPAPEYERYHTPFLWMAQFAIHFVNFLLETNKVGLLDFRARFHAWLLERHGNCIAFRNWHAQFGRTDFRCAITANHGYLWKETWAVDDRLTDHSIWSEINPYELKAIMQQPVLEQQTIVSPFVYNCFKRMYFGAMLKQAKSSQQVLSLQHKRRQRMKLTPLRCRETPAPLRTGESSVQIKAGDVVCVKADPCSIWKSTNPMWHAYVQNTRKEQRRQVLDVIWLYDPADTTLGQGFYPFKNELFMSDNCSCGYHAIRASEVIHKVNVVWYERDPEAAAQQNAFFVRQRFRTEHELGAHDFMTLKGSDFRCKCHCETSVMDEALQLYEIGDTVLFWRLLNGKQVLDPAQIVYFVSSDEKVIMRRLHRASRDLGDTPAAPNELVVSDETFAVEAENIIRKCTVVGFFEDAVIPSPFCDNGVGDHFFFRRPCSETLPAIGTSNRLPPIGEPKDHTLGKPKLKSLSLFSGGGNFDRGLADAGAIETSYTVDWAPHALHSFRANLDYPGDTQFFLGSVNDFNGQALQGSTKDCIPAVGDAQVVVAGCPCPAFSNLQPDKLSSQSLKNASLVTAVLTPLDLYTPQYLVFENVPGIAQTLQSTNQNVFSQILCCIVAMGYQVQQYLMEPSPHGSCQSRARLFIVASAPGVVSLERPPHSHAFPWDEHSFKRRKITVGPAGIKIGRRHDDVTPFPFVSFQDATSDLPDIQDAHVYTCISAPDHRTSRREGFQTREMIKAIPKYPRGLGFVQAVLLGKIAAPLMDAYRWKNKFSAGPKSRAWSRIIPDQTIECITTAIKPQDAFGARSIHHDQHRLLTVMEARRAQDFPDHEVIIGFPSHQWRIIGNSVNRKVAFALGLSLRDSWLASDFSGIVHAEAAPMLPSQETPRARVMDRVIIEKRKNEVSPSADSAPFESARSGTSACDNVHEERALATTNAETPRILIKRQSHAEVHEVHQNFDGDRFYSTNPKPTLEATATRWPMRTVHEPSSPEPIATPTSYGARKTTRIGRGGLLSGAQKTSAGHGLKEKADTRAPALDRVVVKKPNHFNVDLTQDSDSDIETLVVKKCNLSCEPQAPPHAAGVPDQIGTSQQKKLVVVDISDSESSPDSVDGMKLDYILAASARLDSSTAAQKKTSNDGPSKKQSLRHTFHSRVSKAPIPVVSSEESVQRAGLATLDQVLPIRRSVSRSASVVPSEPSSNRHASFNAEVVDNSQQAK